MTRIRGRGVALIAVLWLVAAMSLIIAGVVQSVRTEIRTAGQQRQSAVASALGDASILLALQKMHALKAEPRGGLQIIPVQFEGIGREVQVLPLNGLIDLNNAPVLLLAEMYRHAGGLPPELAQAMAQATVETRQFKGSKGVSQGFEAVEDLLRVPNMTYDLYVKVANLTTADLQDGSGRVNPLAAPAGVLQILVGGDAARAASLVVRRNLEPNVMDTSFLKPEFIEMTTSRSLQLQVRVNLPDAGTLEKTWLVHWGDDARSGLPWRVLGMRQQSARAIEVIASEARQSMAHRLPRFARNDESSACIDESSACNDESSACIDASSSCNDKSSQGTRDNQPMETTS